MAKGEWSSLKIFKLAGVQFQHLKLAGHPPEVAKGEWVQFKQLKLARVQFKHLKLDSAPVNCGIQFDHIELAGQCPIEPGSIGSGGSS